MNNKQETFCLFFPEPMDTVDRTNRAAAGVTRVQMFYQAAVNLPEQLRYLAAAGCRVILRIEEPQRTNASQVMASYYNGANHAGIVANIQAIRQIVQVEAVICGNEPEGEYDLRRSGDPNANWGDKPETLFPKGRAWEHQYAVGKVREALAAVGVRVVAPGYSHKRLTPRDAPQPGRAMWARICTDVYNGGPAGLHGYCINWLGAEDENRLLWHVGHELERIQGEAWINEISVRMSALSAVQRMLAVRQMYELLAAEEWSGAIKSFCPFVSNGRTNEEWSPMIMRDPEAYRQLGQWMAS